MVVAQDVEIAVPVRDQRSQRSPAAVIYVLLSAAVLSWSRNRWHCLRKNPSDVAGLCGLVLQARAVESGPVQQNVQRRGGVRIAARLPHHKDGRAAGRQRRGAV